MPTGLLQSPRMARSTGLGPQSLVAGSGQGGHGRGVAGEHQHKLGGEGSAAWGADMGTRGALQPRAGGGLTLARHRGCVGWGYLSACGTNTAPVSGSTRGPLLTCPDPWEATGRSQCEAYCAPSAAGHLTLGFGLQSPQVEAWPLRRQSLWQRLALWAEPGGGSVP